MWFSWANGINVNILHLTIRDWGGVTVNAIVMSSIPTWWNLIFKFLFLRSSNETKHYVEFRHSTLNAPRIPLPTLLFAGYNVNLNILYLKVHTHIMYSAIRKNKQLLE